MCSQTKILKAHLFTVIYFQIYNCAVKPLTKTSGLSWPPWTPCICSKRTDFTVLVCKIKPLTVWEQLKMLTMSFYNLSQSLSSVAVSIVNRLHFMHSKICAPDVKSKMRCSSDYFYNTKQKQIYLFSLLSYFLFSVIFLVFFSFTYFIIYCFCGLDNALYHCYFCCKAVENGHMSH